MRYRGLCAIVATALAAATAPVHAGPAQQIATAPAEKTIFEICRLPGAGAEDADGAIEIPAGSEFVPDAAPSIDPAAAGGPSLAPVTVVTTQAASIPVDRYCVRVLVKTSGGTNARALDAAVGDMFVHAGSRQKPFSFDPLGLTYGYLKSKSS